MEKMSRCAIVGCGVIGPLHAGAIAGVDRAQLVAVCDIDPQKADALAKAYGATAYTDYAQMLKDERIDLVHVCVPSGMHADFGVMAAKAGKNVLVEKPIDITLEAADRLIAACKEAGVMLSCISQHRFDDALEAVIAGRDAGKFGQLNFGGSHTKWFRSQEYYDSAGWRGTWEMDGGGALMNQSVHYVDMLQYIMGDVEEIYAYCATRSHVRIEVEDLAVASVKFKSGALGMIEGNTTANPGFYTRLDIYGDQGGAVIQDDALIDWRMADGSPCPDVVEGDDGQPGGAASATIYGEGHRRQIEDVVDALLSGRPPRITGEEGRKPLAIILAIYESARTGKPVRL